MGAIATWGQLPDESEPAWAAFTVYRNAGASRSLRKTARVVDKCRTLMERWSKRHRWQVRVAAWDLEQQDLHREARIQAISDAEERHGKLARALLGRVAAELGAQVKGRCETCGRSPVKLTGPQIATAMKAGVEVERLALGLSTAGASVVTQHNTTQVSQSTTTALVLLRDPVSQRLASELLGRMRSLDPATSLRRLAGQQAAAALRGKNGKPATGHAAVKAAQAQAQADRLDALELTTAGPSGGDRTAAEELGDGDAAEEDHAEEEQHAADLERYRQRALKSAKNRRYRERVASGQAGKHACSHDPPCKHACSHVAADDDDTDLFPDPDA